MFGRTMVPALHATTFPTWRWSKRDAVADRALWPREVPEPERVGGGTCQPKRGHPKKPADTSPLKHAERSERSRRTSKKTGHDDARTATTSTAKSEPPERRSEGKCANHSAMHHLRASQVMHCCGWCASIERLSSDAMERMVCIN